MAIYILNLGVDFDNTTNNINGDFLTDETNSDVTLRSKVWLLATGTGFTDYQYEFASTDGDLVVGPNDVIGVRVFCLNAPVVSGTVQLTGQLTAVFGRNNRGNQRYRTPFAGDPNAIAVFETLPLSMNNGVATWPAPTGAGSGGSYYYGLELGTISSGRAPTSRTQNYLYEYTVGGSFWIGSGDGYTYGHDPELEVSMGD